MQSTPLEFRLRYLIHVVIFTLGYFAPWDLVMHLDAGSTWLLVAVYSQRTGLLTLGQATITLLLLGILLNTAAAALRTWGAAYLGASAVQDAAMHGDRIVADGPFRHVRNPLYLGTFLHSLGFAMLMPPTGAIFSVLAIGFLQLRLIGGEEVFLRKRLGRQYEAYCAVVPRLLPSIKPRVPASGTLARWPSAFLTEIYLWGVASSFAIVGWRFNASLLIQCIIVSLGVSLVARALVSKENPPPA